MGGDSGRGKWICGLFAMRVHMCESETARQHTSLVDHFPAPNAGKWACVCAIGEVDGVVIEGTMICVGFGEERWTGGVVGSILIGRQYLYPPLALTHVDRGSG